MRHTLRQLAVLLAALTAVATFATSAAAAGAIGWQGQTWDVNGPATAALDVAGDVVVTRTDVGQVDLHVNRVLDGNGDAALSTSDTPWVQISYIDNGNYQGIDLFVADEDAPESPRLSGGSLFTSCDGIGYSRYGAGSELIDFTVGCDTPGRVVGQEHTIYVGQRADGTIDWNFDGVWHTSTFLRDAGVTEFNFEDVLLRSRSNSLTSPLATVFTDFQWGTDHAGPVESTAQCKNGGWRSFRLPTFTNQGDCVSVAVR